MNSIDEDDARRLGIVEHEGWLGAFTRNQAPGAIENGKEIKKILKEKGDRQPIGARGTVLGSIFFPGFRHAVYFVEWKAEPFVAVAVIDWKIARCE